MSAKSVARLKELCYIVPKQIRSISDQDILCKSVPGKWSKLEILGHLVDSATNNHHRLIRSRLEEVPIITYNGDDWVRIQNYQEMDREHVLILWQMYNLHMANVMTGVNSEDLQKEVLVNEDAKVTLAFLIDDYVDHLEHHLKQILTS